MNVRSFLAFLVLNALLVSAAGLPAFNVAVTTAAWVAAFLLKRQELRWIAADEAVR